MHCTIRFKYVRIKIGEKYAEKQKKNLHKTQG